MIDLTGKHALVCGSSQGIGRACAELMAEAGARVALVSRDKSTLVEIKNKFKPPRNGGSHAVVAADFAEPDAVHDAVAAYLKAAGPADILVNNTGGPPAGPIFEAAPEAFERAFRMHVVVNQLLVQTVVPGMRVRGYGRIINIISTSVKQAIPGLGVSNTIRAAVANWAKTLSFELGPFGITVNNILPGYTDTARLRSLLEGRAKREGASFDALWKNMQADIPLRRFADPREIAAAALFLASPLASYVSGLSMQVDGGRTGSH